MTSLVFLTIMYIGVPGWFFPLTVVTFSFRMRCSNYTSNWIYSITYGDSIILHACLKKLKILYQNHFTCNVSDAWFLITLAWQISNLAFLLPVVLLFLLFLVFWLLLLFRHPFVLLISSWNDFIFVSLQILCLMLFGQS